MGISCKHLKRGIVLIYLPVWLSTSEAPESERSGPKCATPAEKDLAVESMLTSSVTPASTGLNSALADTYLMTVGDRRRPFVNTAGYC